MPRIAVVGCYDTKAEPLHYLAAQIARRDAPPITVDTSVFAENHGCDHSAASVAEAGGHAADDLPSLGRAHAVKIMAEGAEHILRRLVETGEVNGVVCMGGSSASTIFSRLVRALPIGLPKVLMATSIAGDTRSIVNASDVILLYPIVDIEGDNTVLRAMIERVAAVAVEASRTPGLANGGNVESTVALTMFGVTTPCVSMCRVFLRDHGLESLVFHANGAGGRSVERFVAQSLISSLVDVTITELADELLGGTLPAGPERLRTAALHGMPQVIVPGAIDMINFGALDTVPARFHARRIVVHNDLVTLVRTTPEENHIVGAAVGERLGRPGAPTVVMVPTEGFSALDKSGGPFFDPDATAAFVAGLKSSLSDAVRLVEVHHHINDPEFAEALVDEALAGRAWLSTRG